MKLWRQGRSIGNFFLSSREFLRRSWQHGVSILSYYAIKFSYFFLFRFLRIQSLKIQRSLCQYLLQVNLIADDSTAQIIRERERIPPTITLYFSCLALWINTANNWLDYIIITNATNRSVAYWERLLVDGEWYAVVKRSRWWKSPSRYRFWLQQEPGLVAWYERRGEKLLFYIKTNLARFCLQLDGGEKSENIHE